MATQWSTFPIEFRGGLISNMSALQHGTNAVGSATILQNFEPNKEGGYSKVKGYEKFSATVVPGSGPIRALKVMSSGRVIAARHNASSETEYYYGTGTTWTSMGNTVGTNGGKVRHVEFNFTGTDKVVFVDGTNYPVVYDSSNNTIDLLDATDSTDLSAVENVAIFKNTAFYSKGNNIFFTAPFSIDDFDVGNGAGTINVGTDVVGLAVFRDQLIIFTTNSIRRLTGNTSADFQLSPITDRIGCINGDTIQEVGGDILYLAPDGLRLISATDRIGDFALDVASDKIQKDAITFLGTASIFSSVILRDKAQYRIFSYIESEQQSVAKGLIATKFISQGGAGMSWATTKGIKAYVADSRYAVDQETVAFANEDGYIYIMDTGNTFDSNIIEAIYESPFMPISDPQIRKTFYKMTLYAEPTGNMNLDVNLKYDFASATNTKKIQPPTFNITSTGNAVFEFGSSSSVYTDAQTFTATAGQTAFTLQDVPYTVGTNTDKVVVKINDVATTAFTVASVADGDNYDVTVTLTSGATLDDAVYVELEPPAVSEPATYGGELDNIYQTNVTGSGKTVALRIEDNSTNPTFTLDTALLEFSQNDRQ